MTNPAPATCRGCGKPIIWGITSDGTKIPLDPRPRCYEIDPAMFPHEDGSVNVAHLANVAVTHFATCPNANYFSRSRKKS